MNDTKAPAQAVKFAGEYLDPTGLYHLRARQYDPSTGRFLTLDPLPNPVTDPYMSAYTYANDRPTVLADPSGLSPVCKSLFCFLKSVPGTVKCELRHPGETAGGGRGMGWQCNWNRLSRSRWSQRRLDRLQGCRRSKPGGIGSVRRRRPCLLG